MSAADADSFIRACATITWLALSLFMLALILQGRKGRDE